MGSMPFHLEKGVLGLRLDYLCRSPAVRAHVLKRLQNGEDPFVVAADINIPGVGNINVLTDRRDDFAAKLETLRQVDPTPADPYERRSGAEYRADQAQLRPANNDSTGNRNAFSGYWVSRQSVVADAMRSALMQALTSGKHCIDFWWECSLDDGADPTVHLMLTPGAAHVLFVTDHSMIEPPNTPARAPLD